MAMSASNIMTTEQRWELLFRNHPEIANACQAYGWGSIEIIVKDGKAVMVSFHRDVKLT